MEESTASRASVEIFPRSTHEPRPHSSCVVLACTHVLCRPCLFQAFTRIKTASHLQSMIHMQTDFLPPLPLLPFFLPPPYSGGFICTPRRRRRCLRNRCPAGQGRRGPGPGAARGWGGRKRRGCKSSRAIPAPCTSSQDHTPSGVRLVFVFVVLENPCRLRSAFFVRKGVLCLGEVCFVSEV